LRIPLKANKIIKENSDLLDTTQDIAIRLTDTLSKAQSLMFKHSEEVSKILKVATLLVSQIPLLNRLDLSNTINVNATIVEITEKSVKVVNDVNNALRNGNIKDLRKYSIELDKLASALKEAIVNQKAQIVQNIPDYNKSFITLQQNYLELVNTLLSMQLLIFSYILNCSIASLICLLIL
jgi:hypothetical protein